MVVMALALVPMFINGEKVYAAEKFESFSPINTGMHLCTAQKGTVEHARSAIAAALSRISESARSPQNSGPAPSAPSPESLIKISRPYGLPGSELVFRAPDSRKARRTRVLEQRGLPPYRGCRGPGCNRRGYLPTVEE